MRHHYFKYPSFLFCLLFCTNIHAQTASDTSDNTIAIPVFDHHMSEMPSFGQNMNDYLSKNIVYPASAKKQHIHGSVTVRFIITATGNVDSVKVVRGLSTDCDKEAIRVVKNMPKWTPGKDRGRPFPAYCTLPVIFKRQ